MKTEQLLGALNARRYEGKSIMAWNLSFRTVLKTLISHR